MGDDGAARGATIPCAVPVRRLPLAAVTLLFACSQIGVTVDVSSGAGVPALDALRVEVSQGQLLVVQSFSLAAGPLPQSVAIVTNGLTQGTVRVVVQGMRAGAVEALGSVDATLAPASSPMHAAVVLDPFCAKPGSCGACVPTACTGACGRLDDGCGGQLDCGGCAGNAACTANRCVSSTCTTCESAKVQCGQISDGCSAFLGCGTCDAGACGADNACHGCVPANDCPAWQDCGTAPDGCGHMLDCGSCTAPQSCGGGGTPNTCGCSALTQCPPGACQQWPDGCGGFVTCSPTCGAGDACTDVADGSGGKMCVCSTGTTCAGTCVDLQSDSANCGSCGNTCPAGFPCVDGLCPCTADSASNADGHCCPMGWHYDAQSTFCYSKQWDPAQQPEALSNCMQLTKSGYGRAVSALGFGSSTYPGFAAPPGVCGTGGHCVAAPGGFCSVDADCANSQCVWRMGGQTGLCQ
jgi:hypothetical protein